MERKPRMATRNGPAQRSGEIEMDANTTGDNAASRLSRTRTISYWCGAQPFCGGTRVATRTGEQHFTCPSRCVDHQLLERCRPWREAEGDAGDQRHLMVLEMWLEASLCPVRLTSHPPAWQGQTGYPGDCNVQSVVGKSSTSLARAAVVHSSSDSESKPADGHSRGRSEGPRQ